MFSRSSITKSRIGLCTIICNNSRFNRDLVQLYNCHIKRFPNYSVLTEAALCNYSRHSILCSNQKKFLLEEATPKVLQKPYLVNPLHFRGSSGFESCSVLKWLQARHMSNALIELKTDKDVVRFNIGKEMDKRTSPSKAKRVTKRVKMSRKAKMSELRFYRLKAKKKMNSPNPEVRIRYKLEKAKRKEEWLIEKLRKFDVPKALSETYDPEILTEEEKFYLKRTGEKKKNYVVVGRRGVFGGVILNMHLHWKKHETVKVVCKPCKFGQIYEYAKELARLSKGIVIDIKPNNTIIFYRGKNYVQPEIMSPPNTLSKAKALEKYQFEQSLEHTSEFIEKLERELEAYQEHLARYRKEKEDVSSKSLVINA